MKKLSGALAKKLKAAKKLWAGAKERSKEAAEFEDYDDGRYLVKLVGAEIAESGSSGRVQVNWKWKFVEGEYKGKTVMDFDGLETEDNLMWLARKLNRLGASLPDDLDDLVEILIDIVRGKIIARIQLITKKDFQNVRIQKLVDDDNVSESEDEDEAVDEDEDSDEDEDEDSDEDEDEDEDEDSDEDEDEDEDEDDEDEDEETGVELETGMRVIAKIKGNNKVGTIATIAKDGTSAKVRLDAGGDLVKVPIENLTVPETEIEEQSEARKSKVKKQTGNRVKK